MPRSQRVALALLMALAMMGFAGRAAADKRVALVIGNSAYQNTPKLTNPRNDAADIAAALKALGFQVVEGFDLDKAAFDRKIHEFATALAGADAGVLFYAGHGLQVGGRNYLVPVDAKADVEALLHLEMVRVDDVQRVMEASSKTNVLFLDACRNNPLARNLARAMGTRSTQIGQGLRSTEAGVGTLISFSTAPDTVASDGAGRNSPYAGSLARHIASATDDLNTILINVRKDVRQETKGEQVPWEHSSLEGRFYFNPAAATASPVKVEPNRLSEAAQAWSAAKDTSSIAVLEAFMARYQDTFYAELARARIEELKQQAAAATKNEPARKKEARPGLVEQTVGLILPLEKSEKKQTPGALGAKPLTADAERALKPKDTFRECEACPEMVVVPAGNFMMGSTEMPEWPIHKVTIAKPFAGGRYEITFSEWDACAASAACKNRPSDEGWGRGDRPVINVTWNEVMTEYLPWLSRSAGKSYRLLSESEWEYAARAGSQTKYAWGNAVGANRANCGGCGSQWDGKQTAPVGSFPPNAFGLYDMHGNVEEWVADYYKSTYSDAPDDGTVNTDGVGNWGVLRGGAWFLPAGTLRSSHRNPVLKYQLSNQGGFRVARTLIQ